MIINALPLAFQRGSMLWVAALIGEEIFDSLQRQMMDDPELQPIIQRLMRIHVTEEARHIQFARDGARKRVAEMPRLNRWFMANINGLGGYFFNYLFSNPIPYARTGLDARRARQAARTSPHRREIQVAGFAPLAAFLTEVGLMGPIARRGLEAQQVSVTPRGAGPATSSSSARGAAGRLSRHNWRRAGITDALVARRTDRPPRSSTTPPTPGSLHAADGKYPGTCRIVVRAVERPYVPWIPDFPGRDDFRGLSFHAAQWDPGFDPAGKRVAVVGADAIAGHHLARLTESAASVTVFAHAPRRIVAELPTAGDPRQTLAGPPGPAGRASRPTAARAGRSGRSPASPRRASAPRRRRPLRRRHRLRHRIRDRRRVETPVGAGGVTIRQAWADGMEPYFGVAVRGFPNYFFLGGPDVGAQARYIVECLRLMADAAATRIEVRRSSQQVFNERACLRAARPQPVGSAFDLSSTAARPAQAYDGAATLTIGGPAHPVRVRLAGRLDPIDGQYHWQGTVFGSPVAATAG